MVAKVPSPDEFNSEDLFSERQIFFPLLIATLLTIACYLTFKHFYPVAGFYDGLDRYINNGYCQLMINIFFAATLYAFLGALGLHVERYHLHLFSQSVIAKKTFFNTLACFLSGRRDTYESSLLTALHRWYKNARSQEDIANLSEYLLLLRGQQHQYNLMPLDFTIWLLPLLGFIGTVVGITQAIGGLEQAVAFSGTAAAGGGLTTVLNGLRFAFDTTLVGLVLVVPTMLYTLMLRARARKLDMYCYEILLNRLFQNTLANTSDA